MKVLHVVHGYHPSRGGCQWLVQQLAERQAQTYGDEVTVFTTVADDLEYLWRPDRASVPPGTEVINGVTVRRFPVFNRLRWLRVAMASLFYRLRLPFNDWMRTIQTGPIIWGLEKAIAESGADVVVATGFPLLHMYYALRGAKRAGIPIILIGALHTEDTWGFDRASMLQGIRDADAYMALTSFEQQYIQEKGITTTPIRVIGAGVDLEPYMHANGRAVREQHGWNADFVVCSIGKFVSRKRYDFLLQAMVKVWEKQPAVRLILVGGYTDYLEELRTTVAKLASEHRKQITVLTDVSEDEKHDILDACDVFVLPSIHESFGIVFIEAWAAKKPVIGANSGAIASLIQPGTTGFTFTSDNPNSLAEVIDALASDRPYAVKIGQQGYQQTCRNHTWNQVLHQFRELCCSILPT